MTIDFWGLGLQAINVLILIWLLSRVFWRPVAAAITKRQETAKAVMDAASATQAEADAALAQAMLARAGIATERSAVLDAAREEADTLAKDILAKANSSAEAMLAAAKTTISHNGEIARKDNARRASDLAMKIAARLLGQLNGPAVRSAFLSQLVEAIEKMPPAERDALAKKAQVLEILTAADPGAEREKIEKAIHAALGGKPALQFVTDPDLIAGVELRSAHFVLYNSWRADLAQVQKAVKDAA